MKQQIQTLSRLARLRGTLVQQLLARVAYQQNLCQRYRNNIEGLSRLCSYTAPMTTPLQRDNQHRYKMTLHKMIELQRRELKVSEEGLTRIRGELLAAMRNEQMIVQVLEGKVQEWERQLARHEQKIQDGLASQAWWRAHGL
ncbi:flagellar FliJ family protein [Pseudomonas profundi]|uniref:flagellar FliJ family protein n=1 Tax=Pseudomonas profundi TaxID=1981513 RepID=UPI00123B1263|nr:flagellar FliJ family protein [Pseudomonas profundi]